MLCDSGDACTTSAVKKRKDVVRFYSVLVRTDRACYNRCDHRSRWSQDLEVPCGQCYSSVGVGHCGRHFGTCLILFILLLGRHIFHIFLAKPVTRLLTNKVSGHNKSLYEFNLYKRDITASEYIQ
uniref:Uncharacterized protein n=1 Tax=Octopus bimaculoides TaxID=37653 RepID=A0A0L8GXY8_OCTBM